MKTTSRVLVSLLTLSALLSVERDRMASAQTAPLPIAGPQLTGQFGDSEEADRKKEASRWLKQAREALDEGKLDLADEYVNRAEKLNVKYDSLFARFVDTPAKVRKDIEAKRGSGAASNSSRPSGDFPASKPRASRQPNSPPGDPNAAPVSNSDIDALTNDTKGRAVAALKDGRAALQDGNIPAAVAHYQRALGLNAPFNPSEYSPESFAAELRRAGVDVSSLAPATRAAPSYGPLTPDQFAQQNREPILPDGLPAGRQPVPAAGQGSSRYIGDGGVMPNGPQPGFGGEPGQFPAADGAVSRLPQPRPMAAGAKQQALKLLSQSQLALDQGDLAAAREFARQADALNVPDREFAANEPRPWQLIIEIESRMRKFGGYPVAQASAVAPLGPPAAPGVGPGMMPNGGYPVAQGVYRPAQDGTRNVYAQNEQPTPADPALQNQTGPAGPVDPSAGLRESNGVNLYQQGVRALADGQRDAALQLFREAWQFRDDMDPITLQQLKDKLTLMQARPPAPRPNVASPEATALEEVESRQEVIRQKLVHEINNEVAQARRRLPVEPLEARDQLERLRLRVNQAEVDPAVRKQLLTNVDRGISEVEQFIKQHQADIELDKANEAVMNDIQLSREKKVEVDAKIAELVDKFDKLVDEQRFAEAEIIAKQVKELAPDTQIAQTLSWKAIFVRRVMEQRSIKDLKEEGFYNAMAGVDRSSIPFDDEFPYQFGDAKAWGDMTTLRASFRDPTQHRLTPAEQEIQRKLETPVEPDFDGQPLSEVIHHLSQMSQVPIHLDQAGLAAEGVTSNTPITFRISQPIALKSALSLILEELNLSYVIQNEVLKISSSRVRETNVYTKPYHVADLVIPIPNFLPGYDQGLAGALREAYRTVGYGMASGMPMGGGAVSPVSFAQNDAGMMPGNSTALAQYNQPGIPGLGSRNAQATSPFGGPGGLGGAAAADFDSLIELITTTIQPDTWDAVGGPGAIQEFPANLSLVISQTQEVHEQIADLLEQLRRLQDLQVTIEVRFITLNDNFFERIGIDFDFDIDDNVKFLPPDDAGPSVTIGLDQAGVPTADFDLQFEQGTFGASVPQFGGFDAATAANFGFAILSDIEMFFVLQAAQGDTRSNVLQAPKVTLFDGQTATVSDTSLRPFVTSVIPVVGDFAAAQAPVILVLSEGTNLSVQAVVSNDKRFVRLTLVPFFSQIGEVEEFTFDGRTTTRSGQNLVDPETGEPIGAVDNAEVIREGTTVQLPTFSFTTVSTTVSVPDGGTVLLGGIKRLREGRTERGLPFANKVPYFSRLFKNVGIGRETNSLMMMVTPRIIIQAEEEQKLGIAVP